MIKPKGLKASSVYSVYDSLELSKPTNVVTDSVGSKPSTIK